MCTNQCPGAVNIKCWSFFFAAFLHNRWYSKRPDMIGYMMLPGKASPRFALDMRAEQFILFQWPVWWRGWSCHMSHVWATCVLIITTAIITNYNNNSNRLMSVVHWSIYNGLTSASSLAVSIRLPGVCQDSTAISREAQLSLVGVSSYYYGVVKRTCFFYFGLSIRLARLAAPLQMNWNVRVKRSVS